MLSYSIVYFFVLYITIDIIYGEARGKIGRWMGMKNGEFHGDFMGDSSGIWNDIIPKEIDQNSDQEKHKVGSYLR